MKILWLYRFVPNYDFDNWLHMRFALTINNQPDTEVMAYGPHLTLKYPSITSIEFDEKLQLSDLYESFKFDVIICCTKSRMFLYYNPKVDGVYQDWLPSDFSSWNKTPKIVLEEDYHYEKNDQWYQDRGIDLILQRHYSQSLREEKVPMKFFPFSVDTNIFNTTSSSFHDDFPKDTRMPLPAGFESWKYSRQVYYKNNLPPPPPESTVDVSFNKVRSNQFCFTGNHADKVYLYRQKVTQILKQHKHCVDFVGCQRKFGADYVKVLREYMGYISGSSTMDICASKNFEIMASGGVLFTNRYSGIDLLFPEGSYLSYKNDFSDVWANANEVIQNPSKATEITTKAQQVIQERHTHEIRIKELKEIINEL